MSGFSFPPPPPPPPKTSSSAHYGAAPPPAHDRGPRRDGRGQAQQRGRGHPSDRGYGGHNHSQRAGTVSYQSAPGSGHVGAKNVTNHPWTGMTPQGYAISTPNDAAQPLLSPQRTAAGHKRKLEALRGHPAAKQNAKPAPALAPATPTFGAPFLHPSTSVTKSNPSATFAGSGTHKPPARGLGLTPATADPHYSSSDNGDDEQNDEEAMYAELGNKLTFEHNGIVMSLESQADLLAWKRERQRKWPTRARMAEKDEERKKVGEERKRLLAGGNELYGTSPRFAKPGSNIWTNPGIKGGEVVMEDGRAVSMHLPETQESDLENAKRQMEEKANRLEELRRRVLESERRNRKARESAERNEDNTDEIYDAAEADGDGPKVDDAPNTRMQDIGNEPANPAAHSVSSVDTSSDTTDSSSSEADSDDEPPEEIFTKAPATESSQGVRMPPCKYFRASGHCRNGDACRFSHESIDKRASSSVATQQPDGGVRKDQRRARLEQRSSEKKKMTIFQRLVEQEEEDDDRLTLKVVKYLGECGFFRAA